jgi:hypothetical protein
MRIVNREQFLAMPSGTLFAEYDPMVATELIVKWDTCVPFDRLNGGDYTYQNITLAVKSDSGGDFTDKMIAAQDDPNLSLEMDFDCSGRAGDYDTKQLYLVYEAEDLRGMIALLQKCLDTAIKN